MEVYKLGHDDAIARQRPQTCVNAHGPRSIHAWPGMGLLWTEIKDTGPDVTGRVNAKTQPQISTGSWNY
jgi:hypothetical protein